MWISNIGDIAFLIQYSYSKGNNTEGSNYDMDPILSITEVSTHFPNHYIQCYNMIKQKVVILV